MPGTDKCPNDFEGHYTLLSSDTVNGLTQLYDRKNSCKKFIARQNENHIRSRIRSFYIDEKAVSRLFVGRNINEGPGAREGSRPRLRYIDRTKEHGLQEEGLYLAGRFGTGKTILDVLSGRWAGEGGFSGVIVYMPDFVEDLKSLMHEPGKLKETVEMMKETDLLIFDDKGAENLNPWVRDHVLARS